MLLLEYCQCVIEKKNNAKKLNVTMQNFSTHDVYSLFYYPVAF